VTDKTEDSPVETEAAEASTETVQATSVASSADVRPRRLPRVEDAPPFSQIVRDRAARPQQSAADFEALIKNAGAIFRTSGIDGKADAGESLLKDGEGARPLSRDLPRAAPTPKGDAPVPSPVDRLQLQRENRPAGSNAAVSERISPNKPASAERPAPVLSQPAPVPSQPDRAARQAPVSSRPVPLPIKPAAAEKPAASKPALEKPAAMPAMIAASARAAAAPNVQAGERANKTETSGAVAEYAPHLPNLLPPSLPAILDGPVPSPVDHLLAPQSLRQPVPSEAPSLRLYSVEPVEEEDLAPPPYSLPQKIRGPSRLDVILFLVCFVLPTLVGGVYFGFIASKQYVSEFRFNVVDTSDSAAGVGGLASVLSSTGLGPTVAASYSVADYITSPQALKDVEKKIPLRQYFTTKEADWWARLNPSASEEKFLYYWQKMVYSDYDPVTGIANASVRAFDPTAAYTISRTLLSNAEALVNEMQARRYNDAVRFAQLEVDRANAKLTDLRKQMLALRDKTGVVEPGNSAVAENIQLATNLRLSLVQLQGQLASIKMGNPQSPLIPPLNDRIKGAQDQLDKVDEEISTQGGSAELSKIVGMFEDLNARESLALQELTGDLNNLIQARAAADAQHIYLMTYVKPTMPTSSTYPNRPMAIALVVLIAFGVWCFAKLCAIVIRSHAA